MSSISQPRKILPLVLLLVLVLTMTLTASGAAFAEGAPHNRVPGYPKYGCYDVVTSGQGMWSGYTPYSLSIDVPGPVVDAYLTWIGTEDIGASGSPNQSDLVVNGVPITGALVDTKNLGANDPIWYMWRADVGPSGANLVSQGYGEFDVTGWGASPSAQRRNGIALVVVYNTGNCVRLNQVELLDSMDYYWERRAAINEGTTDAFTYTFPPAPVDREATVWLHHAGTDHTHPCRQENLWAATGTGAPPTSLVYYFADPPVGINGGIRVVENGFDQASCQNTTWKAPVTSLTGWTDGIGPTPNTGGFVRAEWSFIKLTVKIPAGATWLVMQGESEKTGAANVEETGESGALFGQFSIPLYNPELRITKTDGVDQAAPGDQLTYTIDYENYGYGPADGVVIVDTLPEHVSFVSATGGGVYDPATHTVRWELGTVAVGQQGQVAAIVQVAPVLEAGTYTFTNAVVISTTTPGELDLTDNSDTDDTTVTAAVELEIDKTAAPDPVDAGGALTYTIDWTVGGNAYAHGVLIVDTLPADVTFVSATDGGAYNPADHTVTWSLGEVTPVTSGSYQVVVTVATPLYNGTQLENSVVISDAAGDTADDSFTSTVRSSHELVIEKTSAPEPVDAGGQLTYTINWAVTGNEPAHNARIVDTLPAEIAAVVDADGGTYNAATRTITWELGDVMTPQSGSFTVVVQVASPLYNGTLITNRVDFSDQTPGSTPVSDTATNTVRSSHQLAIEKLAAPEPVDAGGSLTYTINWAVTGNEPARNAVIVDTLPDNVTVLDAGGGVVDAAARTITWSLGEVLTPQSGSFTVVVQVATPLYDGTLLTNTVVFSDETPGSTPVSDTVTSTVRADHTLWLMKYDDPDPVEKGAQLTYTLEWRVTGNEPADNVVLVDELPFGTQFISASDGGVFDPATGDITWNLGNKVPGDEGLVTLVVRVNNDFPNDIAVENRAVISDDKPGTEREANEDTAVVQTFDQYWIGDTVWMDLNANGIKEPGEPGLSGVRLVLSDAGPDGLCGTADDAELATTTTDASGLYRFSRLEPGVSYCVAVDDTTLPAGLGLVSGTDPHGPVVLTEAEPAYPDADFGYGSAGGGVIGDWVWNDADGDGTQDAGEVGIAGVTLDLATAGPDGLCGTADDAVVTSTTTGADGSYLFTGLPAGSYCVNVTDTAGVLAGAALTGGTDPHGPIDLAAGEIYLDADFGYQSSVCTGQIGNLVFYDANRNGVFQPALGEVGISGVTIDLVSGGVVIASVVTDANGGYLFTGLCDGDYQVVITDLNGRLIGYTQTYGVPNTDNNGQVSPFAATIVDGNSVLYADFGYADGHLLSVSKANNVSPNAVEAGAELVYTINYSVSGREPAPNVVLRDMLPSQVEFVSASDGGVYDAALRVVTWNLGNLDPGASGSVTLTVRVKKPLPNNSYIFNTVVISDDAGVTDEATDVVRVHAAPILSLDKSATPAGAVEPGDTIEYKLCYANTGNGNATAVVLTDVIPTFTTYVANSANPAATYDAASRTLTWSLGTLAPDASACGTFRVLVDLTIPGVTGEPQFFTIHNIAELASAELPTLTDEVSNPLNAWVDPTLVKTANPSGEVLPGDTIEYSLCYANEGNANLTGVVITDDIPDNTTYVSGSAVPAATYDEAARTLTWNLGTLGPGENGCLTFKVTVNMIIVGLTGQAEVPLSFAEWNAMTIDNYAVLQSDQVADEPAETSNPLNATVDLAIYKSVDKSEVFVAVGHQETLHYTVTVVNNGTATATNVVVTDEISTRLYDAVVTTSKGTITYDAVTRVWTAAVGELAPGEQVVITITVKTEPVTESMHVPFSYDVTNVATVSFTEGTARDSNEVTVRVRAMAPEAIPEPGTIVLLGSGLASLAGYARMRQSRRRKNG